MKKVIGILLLIVVSLAAYHYFFNQPSNDIVPQQLPVPDTIIQIQSVNNLEGVSKLNDYEVYFTPLVEFLVQHFQYISLLQHPLIHGVIILE